MAGLVTCRWRAVVPNAQRQVTSGCAVEVRKMLTAPNTEGPLTTTQRGRSNVPHSRHRHLPHAKQNSCGPTTMTSIPLSGTLCRTSLLCGGPSTFSFAFIMHSNYNHHARQMPKAPTGPRPSRRLSNTLYRGYACAHSY
jgi:hypothetical protein